MLTQIKLERFRGFQSLETELRPLTAVVGKNSSGKTTLLHAVRIAIEALAIGLEEAWPHLRKDGLISVCNELIVPDFARLHPTRNWDELFTNKEVGEGGKPLQIEIHFNVPDGIHLIRVQLAYARNHQLKMGVTVESPTARELVKGKSTKSKYHGETLHQALLERMPRAIFVPAFYGVTRAEEYRTRAIVTRLLGGGDQSRIVRNLVAQLSSQRFERLNDFLSRTMGAVLTTRTTAQDAESVQRLEVLFRDTNGELELSSAGAGLINLIALYSAMAVEQHRPDAASKRSVIFLLDEPEAHLHPKLQGDIGEALGELATEFGAQLLVATHSVEMINRLGQRTDALLLAVDRANSAITKLDSEAAIIQELAQWCDLTPFTSLNFLSSRRILFHEGPSDADILASCGSIYFRNDPVKLARFRAWTLTPLHGAGNVKAVGVLRAVLTPRLYPSLGGKQKVRAICVLDRDAEREPGLRTVKELSKDHFEAHELIWSRYSIESLFLEPVILSAWLALVLPGDEASSDKIRTLVEEGLELTNHDQKLQDQAEQSLMLANLRKQMKPAEALKHAKEESRANPAIWQPGKGRADTILKHVREHLPKHLQKHVRGSIASLIEAASVGKLGDINALIPEELRRLFDLMTEPDGGGAATK